MAFSAGSSSRFKQIYIFYYIMLQYVFDFLRSKLQRGDPLTIINKIIVGNTYTMLSSIRISCHHAQLMASNHLDELKIYWRFTGKKKEKENKILY
jgi:hypothetical protein